MSVMRPSGATRRSAIRGASLLEVMIATVVVSVVVLGTVEFFAKGHLWFRREEQKRVATLLAQDSLERTIALDYGLVANWAENRSVSSTSYAIAVTVQNNAPESNMKTVRSVVTWNVKPSVQRSVSLATLVYNN
ncbi:MAG: hypothetical protein FJY88_00620 [Candidatus Eisenbacteria bacterium]|nr:hypothetical protein [Candidatus Eisenbacteria bacterium]